MKNHTFYFYCIAMSIFLWLNGTVMSEDFRAKFKTWEYGISLVKDQPQDKFVEIKYDELPASIRSQTENRLPSFFKRAAMPHKAGDFQVKVYYAKDKNENDLLEYRWIFEKLPLRLVESLNAVKLEMPLGTGKDAMTLERVKLLIEKIVRIKDRDVFDIDYEIKLRWPAELKGPIIFSSNSDQDIVFLPAWHSRIDASINGDILSLILYKKIYSRIGYLDGSSWFKDSTKKDSIKP